MKRFQTIVVGAGPAGLCAALALYKENIKDICIIEIQNRNFHKPCAGLLTSKSNDNFKLLGIDVQRDLEYYKVKNIPVFNDDEFIFEVQYKNKEDFSFLLSRKPDRKTLDTYMREKCEDLGIKIFYETQIEDLNIEEKELKTNKDVFKYDSLIFADGVNGFSRRYNKLKSKNISVEAVVKATRKEEFVNLYFGVADQGYAWIANTGTYVNIGFTDLFEEKTNYVNKLIEFAKKYGYDIAKKDVVGATYPNHPHKNVAFDDIYLIGDAAGITDPWTAEGLYYASSTAMLVVKAIKNNDNTIYLRGIRGFQSKSKFHHRVKKFFYRRFIRQKFFNLCKKKTGFISFLLYHYLLKGTYNTIVEAYREYKKSREIVKNEL